MIDPTEAASWITAGKSGLDLMRSAWTLLPKGVEKDRIARKLEEAELALETFEREARQRARISALPMPVPAAADAVG